MSAYDDVAPKLLERGYFPLPIGPGTKKPQRLVGSGYCDLTGWADPGLRPETSPQPGAGIGLRLGRQPDGTFVVALDWDNDDAFIAAMDSGVWSPIQKVGSRGGTTLFRSAREIPSRDFKISGKIAVQVLAQGKQTVLPPSLHPETGKPYWYGDERATLDTCRASELPLLPDDYVEHIESILRPLGLDEPEPESEPEVKTNGHDNSGEAFDTPCGQLNAAALKQLVEWVPALGLYNCKRGRGHPNYVAVATWRPSGRGRPLETRGLNLKINSKGIKDHGDGRTYSAIDLVMAARECDLTDAVSWLNEKLGLSIPDIEVETLLKGEHPGASSEAPKAEAEAKAEDPQSTPDKDKGAKDEFEEVPTWWGLGGWVSANPKPPKPWLVEGTIPLVGAGLISGQTGAAKTWIGTNLAACTLMEKPFAGMHVGHAGGVLYFEVENSCIDVRIRGACEALGGNATQLPFLFSEALGPLFVRRRLDKAQVKVLRDKIIWAKRAMLARFGVQLRLVVLDTLTSIAGIEDHDDTAESAAFMNFCADLAKEMEVFIAVCDHFGKNIDAGTRGSSAKEGRADAVLAVLGKPDQPPDEPRKLLWRKIRNGVSGREIQFRLRKTQVVMGGVLVDTRCVEFILDGAESTSPSRRRGLGNEHRVALNILADCIKQKPVPVPPGLDIPGMMGCLAHAWREAWRSYQAAVSGKGESERFKKQWQRMFADLKLAGAVSLAGEVAWSPSSFA
jgi:AAA domain/Bifunctional DNA primase/polymerase, N-terminal